MADEAEGTEGMEGAAGAEGAATTEAAASSQGGQEKLLPQSEVDRIVQDRLARAAKGQPSKDELAELKRKAEAHDAAAEASQTELEKAQARADKAEQKAAEALTTAHETLKRSAALAELAKQGVTNIDGALRALDRTGLTVEDDGTVSGAEEAVKSLLEVIPEFVGKVVPPKVDQGARGTAAKDGQVTAEQLEGMNAVEIARATRQGRMKDLLS